MALPVGTAHDGPVHNENGPIIVAVETSEGSDEAIRQADSRARASSSDVVYCAAFPDTVQLNALMPRLSFSIDVGAIRGRIEGEVRERVASLTGRAASEVDVRVLAGIPHEAVTREAERLGASLIVVGSGPPPGVVASLRGTVAERTVRYAHAPVLVARSRRLTGVVLVATDFSDAHLPALEAAAAETRRIQGKLTATHCIDVDQLEWINGSFTATRGWVDLSERSLHALRADAEARLVVALATVGIEGSAVVLAGDPASAIVAAATERNAEIIVVGTAGRKGLKRMTLGSVAEAVVRHADTSVLVVRLDEAYENG